MDEDRIFMDALKKCREDLEKEAQLVTKKIKWVEQLGGFWKRLLRPYLNNLKKKKDKLEKSHFRFDFSEKIGKKNPSLAKKLLFGKFFQD